MPNEFYDRYNLITAENRLVSQYAQPSHGARVLQNFLTSPAGDLKRKTKAVKFANEGPQGDWWSWARDYLFFVPSRASQRILVSSNNVGSFLYTHDSNGAVTALPTGATTPPHNPVSGWIGDPLLLYSDGLLFISDGFSGANGTVYDGQDTWKWGMDIPTAPTLNTSSTPGSIGSTDNPFSLYREYVLTEYDSVRVRESPPSARLRFTPASSGTWDVTLNIPARVNDGAGYTTGAADKFRIYASRLDGSTELFRVAEIDATDSPQTWIDTVPFFDVNPTAMVPFRPPFRNQKKRPSKVGTKWYNRFIIRDESRPSRLWISGEFEIDEQSGGVSGLPLYYFPGAQNEAILAADTARGYERVSDYVNSIELPDESYEIRALLWWQEGLMIGTERSVTILWGQHPEEWRISNSTTYGFGIFGKNGFLVTPHGLIMYTNDRKLVLDPVSGPSAGDRTDQVIDLGWPIQEDLDKTDIRFTNRFQMVHWLYGRERDWLVIAYTTQDETEAGGLGIGHLKIYDFMAPGVGGVPGAGQNSGWLDITDVQATCVGIIHEDIGGYQFLVAGNSVADKELKVAVDFTPVATSPYQAADARLSLPAAGTATLPANVYRTALLDFESPDRMKVFRYLSFYQKGGFTVTVKIWMDPADVDNLGAEDFTLTFQTQYRTQERRAWIWKRAKRILFEFSIAADTNEGSLQGLEVSVRKGTQAAV